MSFIDKAKEAISDNLEKVKDLFADYFDKAGYQLGPGRAREPSGPSHVGHAAKVSTRARSARQLVGIDQ